MAPTNTLKTLFFLLLAQVSLAQLVVTDESGQPLEYVLAQNKALTQHTHSNAAGEVNLEVFDPTDTLTISYLGYSSTTYKLSEHQKNTTLALEPTALLLETVSVTAGDPLTTLSTLDVELRPELTSQELLRLVPGLFIGQHAGGGKAEQFFLRGFDIDHGTDLSLTVDGMPVNMVSHAHGQGYADLHFVIPESIEQIDYGKGPYEAEQGNFATAGHVDFRLKKRLNSSFLATEAGQFGHRRLSAGLQVLDTETQGLYLLGEALQSDGPFVSPQNLSRGNVLVRYNTRPTKTQEFNLTASHFSSSWDASGQIPPRAIASGLITRFGAIDDTEGGETSRSNFMLAHRASLNANAFVESSAYYSRYNFDLWSNFTFFAEDPINGDQIRQRESRDLFGAQSVYNLALGKQFNGLLQAGVGFRSDRVDEVSLFRTLNRTTTLERLALGNVEEDNYFLHSSYEMDLGKLNLSAGLRYDEFVFRYENLLTEAYAIQADRTGRLSPKLKLRYQWLPAVAVYAKLGRGFHSNDSRAIATGQVDALVPAATGADLGTQFKIGDQTLINAAVWGLLSDQEFVYVGDAGIVEPSGKTRRFGLDLSLRSQLAKTLFLDGDYTYAHARAIGEETGEDFIPLAPVHTFTGGLSHQTDRFTASLRTRVLADRPGNEDYSLVATGYMLFDATIGYRWRQFEFGLFVENLLNEEWREAQFATESRLQVEAQAVEEMHFTPGVPRMVRAKVSLTF